jgi:spermidine synthase
MIRLPLLSIGLLSASALAYELLLMRLFAIIHWHHFAYLVIGLALLGHGCSGSLSAIFSKYLLKHFNGFYITAIALFATTCILCFQVAQLTPFNAEEILWDWRQSAYLLMIFLFLCVPFFAVGLAICLALLRFRQQIGKLYAADLLGAGAGCIVAVLLLSIVHPQKALFCIGILAWLAACLAVWELKPGRGFSYSALIVSGLLVVLLGSSLQLAISPHKGLQRLLLVDETRIVKETSGPLGLLTVVASDKLPLRHAPGMSITSPVEPLSQLALFSDADNMTVITAKPDKDEQLAYLDQMTSALGYHFKPLEDVLIIGAGSGSDVLQARYFRPVHIDAVEINPQYIELAQLSYNGFQSDVYHQPNVSVHIADGRDFLIQQQKRFQLIQISLLDSFNAASAGLYALNEGYLYTVEAIRLYLSRLQPGGYLSITRWVKLPPRDTLKLFNTVVEAIASPEAAKQQLMMIRSWQTATLIVKNGQFSHKEIEAAEQFSQQRNFDLVYSPALQPDQVNYFNRLHKPLYYSGTQALLSSQRDQFLQRYKFNLQPATDDRPYFQHFFRWSALPEMLTLLHKGGASLIESGYLILLAGLVIATISSFMLIVLPIWLSKKRTGAKQSAKRFPVMVYFFAIGIAFLFLEIACLQKFILFLHHPVFAASAVLCAFLVFAGAGSAFSYWIKQSYANDRILIGAISILLLITVFYLITLPWIFSAAAQLAMGTRFVLSVGLIAPLAFVMGMPMPLGLDQLGHDAETLLPWAWAINGCASVISAVLASLLAMQFGFTTVILLAILLYFVALMVFPKLANA